MKPSDYGKPLNTTEDNWNAALQFSGEQPLPDDFTARVMEQVRGAEILPAHRIQVPWLRHKQISQSARRAWTWGMAVTLGTVIAASAILYSPSLLSPANTTPSPGSRVILPKEWTDLHLMKAKELGIIQQPDIQVYDQGYTLSLQEVVADPNRMVINLRITDRSGQPANNAMSMFSSSWLKLRNEAGQIIGKGTMTVPMESRSENGTFKQEYLLMSYIFPNEEPGETVVIEAEVNELTVDSKRGKVVTGDWGFSYKVDMTKANALTQTTKLDNTYTTPEGLSLEMENIVRSPAGVKLEFTTLLTDQAQARTPAELRDDLELMFHFENAKNEVLSPIVSSHGAVYTKHQSNTPDKLRWSYYVNDLPYDSDSGPVRFILDGYAIPVTSEDSFTVRPQMLKQQPAIFNAQGDLLKVHDIKITETADEPGPSAWMAISGQYFNRLAGDQWIARDELGQKYEVVRRGSYSIGEDVTFGQTDDHTNLIYLIAKNVKTLPKELTLTRTLTDKKYTNVAWSFELPEGAAKD
ncbi:DUF4179 domain-containing protein [Paenibacillus donghaensis]|uniref:DUF4179 domain-containing protein n=1 Tax=Paenibacillus donghaensis TaxID=414771 RepID=A0A2Z2KBU3_9BACL|nr:DUF4179 domain-containing protein [Paenibacillus donghaensis]ASA21175.1 hypothetical protein B9T62_10475 [Paenibacillus donghaensis]